MKKVLMILMFLSIVPAFALMSPDLIRIMETKDAADLIPIDIVFKEQMDIDELNSAVQGLPRNLKRVRVAEILKDFSAQRQNEILTYLGDMEQLGKAADIKSFWINNAIYCRANIEIIEILNRHEDIFYVDYDLKPMKMDNPPHSVAPPDVTREIAWGVLKVRADQVWPLYTGQGIVVGVIDTGVNYNHVDLASHMWTDPNYPNHGWNFENDSNDPMDVSGHGTHCAGSVASDGTAGSQCGVAPEAQIMACRVRTVADTIAENQVWAAMQFVVSPPLSPANGGDLISMSLGWRYSWNPRRATWRTNCNNVGATGIVMIVAAGNEGGSSPPSNLRCPGDVPSPWWNPENGATGEPSDVVTIGATDINDAIANFSSRGPVTWQTIAPFNDYTYPPGLTAPDVSAPGVNVKSCAYNNNTGYLDGWNGTSMATPHTAGVAALMLEKNYLLTPLEIDSILQTTAIDLGPAGKDNDFGAGRIDALNAINATPPPFSLRPCAHWIDDPAPGGNGNGMWESGEEVNLTVPVYNQSSDTAESSVATLGTSDAYVTIMSGTANLGDIVPGDTVDAVFIVSASASAPLMHLVDFDLNLAYLGGDWDYSLQQYINPLPTLLYEHCTVIDGGNGILDPGEDADLVITLKNEGAAEATNVTSTLMTSSPYITINDNSGNFGNIIVGDTANNAADPYNITASATTPTGTLVDLQVEVVSGSYIDTLDFSIVVGKKHYYLWDPDPVAGSGQIMDSILAVLGYSGDYGTNLTADLTMYQACLVATGVYPDRYLFTTGSAQAAQLVDFLENEGGRVYMEGSATWYIDPYFFSGYDFRPTFGMTATAYSYNDMGPVVGETGTFTTGMSFTYGGQNAYMDHLNATGTGFLVFHDGNNGYNCGVANDASTYRSVGVSFELGGLVDATPPSTREALLDSIMKFFGIIINPGVEEGGGLVDLPLKTMLSALYPNPGIRIMRISYQVAHVSDVSLCVYDATGRLVRTLEQGTSEPGFYTMIWDTEDDLGRRVPAGVYFVRFETEYYQKTEKAVLLR